VRTKHSQITMWSGVVCLLALLLMLLTAHPLVAASPQGTLDVAKIDAFVREEVERQGIPGLAIAVVDGNQIVHMAGYGMADDNGRPVTPQTPFVLASVSKPITALAVMQLVEAGKLELDTPVQRYLPAFRVADPVASQQITLRHLLKHTSGIPEQGCQNSRFATATLDQFVTKLQTIELDAPPGTHHFYCSGNYNVLGRVIEVVSGQSYASYIEQHVFAPLQMRHSFTSEQAARRDGLAQGYRWLFGISMPTDYPYDVPQMPSGFLIASAEDMAHFVIAQLNGGRFGTRSVLTPAGIVAMHAPGVPRGGDGATYGLGWVTGSLGGVPAVYHTGDHPDAHTLVFIEPHTRRGAVLLMNANNIPALATAFPEIQNGVVRLLAGQEPGPMSSLSLRILYLIVDAVLGGLLALALWPIVRMRRWEQQLRQRQQAERLRLWWSGLRLASEIGVPVALLAGARLLLHMLGAQSWAEGLSLFPDFGAWLWAISLLMLLAATIRLVILRRLLRQHNYAHGMTSPSVPARQRRA
jgi:CubicO group peptidase (beta-lactamase class C family)